MSPSTIAIGAVALVVVIVVAIVLVKVTGGSSTASSGANGLRPPTVTTAAPGVLNQLASVPASVQDTVGAWKSVGISGLTGPSLAPKSQPVLKLGSSPLPAALYIGGMFCPYCAATRWSLYLAFSKFGTFSNVGETTSSPWDSYPDTPTLDFTHTTFTSTYVNFQPVEYLSQDTTAVNTHTVLTPLTAQEKAVYAKYDNSAGVPFVDIGNKVLVTGAPIYPQLLAGMTQGQVASTLTNANSPVTQAIVGTANDFIAGICSLTGQQPSTVCTNPGVHKAAIALGI